MPTEFVQQTFDIGIMELKKPRPKVRRLKDWKPNDLKPKEKALRILVGLLGEPEPQVLSLAPTYDREQQSRMYRFDWLFGLALPIGSEDHEKWEPVWWNWQKKLRRKSALTVQILISQADSGFGFTDISATLLALPPSRDTRSWLEINADRLGKALADLSRLPKGAVPGPGAVAGAVGNEVGAILRTSSIFSNFIASRKSLGRRNWFIYRYFDAEENCTAIEWRINRRVLREYGPLLRGSLVLLFHGAQAKHPECQHGIRIEVRPGIGFYRKDELSFVQPTKVFEPKERVSLLIKPVGDPHVSSSSSQ